MSKHINWKQQAVYAGQGAIGGAAVYAVGSTIAGSACTPAGLGISAGGGAAVNLAAQNFVVPAVRREAEKYKQKKLQKKAEEAVALAQKIEQVAEQKTAQ